MWKYAIAFMCVGTIATAQTNSINLALPGALNNHQSDKFRAGDLDCSNAIGSATQLEFGVTGIIDDEFNQVIKDVGVYGRIVIPIGKVAEERINCNRLYELELRRKELEVLKLEQEIKALQDLQFEN